MTDRGTMREFDAAFTVILPRLYSRVAVITGSGHAADDLVQDVYVRLRSAAHRREQFLAHPNRYGYALATAVNLAKNHWRSQQRLIPLDDAPSPLTDGGLANAESQDHITHLLSSLTPKEAAVVLLVDLDGHSLDEAATLLGVHKGTAQRNRQRALDKLRKLPVAGVHP